MLISGNNRMSRIASCLEAAHHFLLSTAEAIAVVEWQLDAIAKNWLQLCEEAALAPTDRNLFWGRQFLNPYAFTELDGNAAIIKKIADEMRANIES